MNEPQSNEQTIPPHIALEYLAMNIVHQIGDALYEALPPDVAHEHFVKARQATNDVAIDFAKKLITRYGLEQRNQGRFDQLEDANKNMLQSNLSFASRHKWFKYYAREKGELQALTNQEGEIL